MTTRVKAYSSSSVRALPTLAHMAAARSGKSFPKAKSRLEVKADAKPLTRVDEQAFRTEVWTRDKGHCRMCGRKVIKTMARVPERGEVHHLHGRIGILRFEAKSAVLTCCVCHEKLTGRVAERWVLEPTVTVWWWCTLNDGTHYIDARKPLTARRVA